MVKINLVLIALLSLVANSAIADTTPNSNGPATTAESQNFPMPAPDNNNVNVNNKYSGNIEITTAAGDREMTIIDENGNLKVVDKATAEAKKNKNQSAEQAPESATNDELAVSPIPSTPTPMPENTAPPADSTMQQVLPAKQPIPPMPPAAPTPPPNQAITNAAGPAMQPPPAR